jgi:uncharacterized membrane protein
MSEGHLPPTPPGPDRGAWSDERVELVIGNLLRAGVLMSALVVAAGGLIYLFRHGREPALENRVFNSEPTAGRGPFALLRNAWETPGRGLIAIGLLLLIATPIARVVFAVVAFARQHDRTYVVVTLIVLAILLYSLFSGAIH